MGFRFLPDGRRESLATGAASPLPRTTVWRVDRETLVDAGAAATIEKTLEDTPFYARSLIRTRLAGQEALAMHESLDLNRFRSRWVQCLLPFRMPRFPRR